MKHTQPNKLRILPFTEQLPEFGALPKAKQREIYRRVRFCYFRDLRFWLAVVVFTALSFCAGYFTRDSSSASHEAVPMVGALIGVFAIVAAVAHCHAKQVAEIVKREFQT